MNKLKRKKRKVYKEKRKRKRGKEGREFKVRSGVSGSLPRIVRKTIGNMRKGKRKIKYFQSSINKNTVIFEILDSNILASKKSLSYLQKKIPFKTLIIKEGIPPFLFISSFIFIFKGNIKKRDGKDICIRTRVIISKLYFGIILVRSII